MVKHCAESIDISRPGKLVVIPERLFRGHVTRRAESFDCAGDRAFGFSKPSQSKICEVRFALGIHQYVSRLDISMENTARMRVMHSARELGYQFRCPANRQE